MAVSRDEQAALSFGTLIGYLVGAGLTYFDAPASWWFGLIGLQVIIVGLRLRSLYS